MGNHDIRHERWSAAIDARAHGADQRRSPLSASVETLGPWTVVTIAGEMDLRVVPLVRELVGTEARQMVFDLRRVTFMDACGLGLLLASRRTALQTGGCVRLVAPSRKVRRLLMLIGATTQLATFTSADEAISAPIHHSAVGGIPAARPTEPVERAAAV